MEKNNSSKNAYNFEYNNRIELPNDNIYIKPKWGLENINIVQITDEIHINKNEDLETNYFHKTFLDNKFNNIFILLLLPIIIISELFYRKALFSLSLQFEFQLRKYLSDYSISFLIFITKTGAEYFIIISVIYVFFTFSLIQTFVYFLGLTISVYIQSLMKIIYGHTRPFLENPKLYNGVCDGGFGNPSGHALVCCYSYLILLHYINNKYFIEKKIRKILLSISFYMVLLLVIISRIFLGLHSINQVIYGSSLGIWIYSIFIHVFKLNKISMITYRKIYQNFKYIFFVSLLFLLSILILIFSSLIFNRTLNYINLNNSLNLNCKKVKQYRRFNNEGIFESLIIMALIGLYYGQFIFWFLSDKYYKKNISNINNDYYLIDELINNWNRNKCYLFQKKENVLKNFKSIVVCISPLLLFFLISSDNDSVIIIFLIKFSVPLLLISFLFFGFGLYWFILLYIGNKENIINNYYQYNIDDI